MLNLSNTTLLCVENRSPELGLYAINKCLDQATFHEVVFITNKQKIKPNNPIIKLYECPNFKNGDEYSIFMLRNLHKYFTTDFCLVIQWDGFILNPLMWQSDFFKYDYVGSSWPHHPDTPVGNGGFSLRSKRLALATASDQFIRSHPEDQAICINNLKLLTEKLNMRFPPKEIANSFSIERESWQPSFGFHGFFNFSEIMDDLALHKYLSNMPSNMLGGHDTYDLIKSLIKKRRMRMALYILKMSHPHKSRKLKLHRRHLTLLIKVKLHMLLISINPTGKN